ncbi:MAG TPA: AAA family ATPase, partial [Myxococcales bacterium]|nr:AAA family ATPase [Myxococcales bacterium]
ELLHGEDLLAHVRAGWPPPRFDEARLRAALPQLVRGLMALHAAGKIHRDVKPSNVMVTTAGRVVLMDFGLAIDAVDASEESLIGTPHYMAPEQITGQNVGPPADYYALGVVLYQLLTGRFPFEGSYSDLLELKRTREPVPPAKLSTRVPEDLSRLTADLLRIHPDTRPTGPQLLQRLGAPLPAVEEAAPPPAAHAQARFVGRQPELDALQHAFQAVRGGEARGVLVHGESGVGKSALARHFVEELRARHAALVLSGRCYEQESVPYKAFDGVVDALSRELLHLDEITARKVLPPDSALVARLFPVLQRVPAVQSMRPSRPMPSDPFELRTEAFAALRTMLRHLAALRPAVLLVDDLQWADQDSLALLGELFSPPSPPPFLLVATLRGNPEDIRRAGGVLAPLAQVTESLQELQLLPLPEADALALAQTLEADAQRAGELVRESGGHPLYLIELSNRGAADARGGAPGAGLEELFHRRVLALPEGARHLLALVTLAGGPIQQGVLARASGLSPWELATHVAELRLASLARTLGRSERAPIEPYHDRVRESVARWLEEPQRRRFHRELATALESSGEETFASLRMLVFHLTESGATERAGHHAARAADLAVQALAFDQAAELYQAALKLFPQRRPEEQQRLKVELARALDYAAKGAAAARAYLEAAQGAEGPERREYRRKAAELLLASGHVDEGLVAVDEVLADFGAQLPANRRAAVASLAWQRLQLQIRGLAYEPHPAEEISREVLDRIDTFYAIQTGLSGVDSVRAFAFQTRGFRLALDAGEELRIGRGMAQEGFNVATAGLAAQKQALDLISRARRIGEARQDWYLLSLSAVAQGMALYLTGEFTEGARLIADGERMQRERIPHASAAVAKEFSTARLLRLQALRMSGDLQEMERSTLEYVRDAVARGDLFAEVSMVRGAAVRHLAADRPERALEDLETNWPPPRGSFHNQHWYSLRMRAEVALYGAEPTARAFLAEEFLAFRRSALPNLQVARVEADWLWARLCLLEAFVPHARAPALREVRRAVKTLESEQVPYA